MDGESAVVNVPDGDSTIVGVPDGGSVVVTLNLGSVRTRGRPKAQDRINKFAKKRKLATNSVVGESAVVDSCGVCGDIELARGFCVNGMIKRLPTSRTRKDELIHLCKPPRRGHDVSCCSYYATFVIPASSAKGLTPAAVAPVTTWTPTWSLL
ncbi:hypothetical protein PoB_005939300 [Plakobranchus ocellatus]|uniref:Uncharacterized protein n=1 Tax=Plakobranchus ocellatus TaxID=259542 RepID=A0AAV4CLB1_9GAST|nr:hypothetical protein PoB_005939300 [Plakobranchus ocellatus]